MRGNQAGVTLVEMLVVVAIVAIITGISFPAMTSGLDSIRLKSASDATASFLNAAMNRVDRRQEVLELVVDTKQNQLVLLSTEPGFRHTLELPPSITLLGDERHVMLLPGGAPPRVVIGLTTSKGRHKLVRLDPITGVPAVTDEAAP